MTRIRHILATPILAIGGVLSYLGMWIYGRGVNMYIMRTMGRTPEDIVHILTHHRDEL